MILFCVPYAGGGAEAFEGWRDELAPTAEVRVAAMPGRGVRFGQPLAMDMPALVADLAQQCEELSTGPFAVLGWSFGAAVAYELTLALQRRDRTPGRLFVGALRAPFLPHVGKVRHRMSDAELVAELAALNGTASEVLTDPDLMAIYLPILRSDFQVSETYRAGTERVRCPLTVLGGDRDEFVSTEDLRAWTKLGGAETSVRLYEGGHFVVHTQRAAMCRAIHADLTLDALAAAS